MPKHSLSFPSFSLSRIFGLPKGVLTLSSNRTFRFTRKSFLREKVALEATPVSSPHWTTS